jgi:putative transposase
VALRRIVAERPDHVWSYDFVEERTHDQRKFRLLNIIDEFTRECLASWVSRRLKSIDVIDVLSDLFILRGVSGHIRSDNGPRVPRQGRVGVDWCSRSITRLTSPRAVHGK